MTTPKLTEDTFLLAAEWLDTYEGDGETEAEIEKKVASIQLVAKFLRKKAAEQGLKDAAKQGGVSVKALKKALKTRGLL